MRGAALLALAGLLGGCGCTTWISVGELVIVCYEEADDEASRRAGLTVYDTPLPDDAGLLLTWPVEVEACITTEPLADPIDVVFLGEDLEVVDVACHRGPDDPSVCVDDVRHVLEIAPREGCGPDWIGLLADRRSTP